MNLVNKELSKRKNAKKTDKGKDEDEDFTKEQTWLP
jgi:hypothetical protein